MLMISLICFLLPMMTKLLYYLYPYCMLSPHPPQIHSSEEKEDILVFHISDIFEKFHLKRHRHQHDPDPNDMKSLTFEVSRPLGVAAPTACELTIPTTAAHAEY